MPTPSQKKRPWADTAEDVLSSFTRDARRYTVKDIIKDTLLVGLGTALLTRDKIEESLRTLVEEGKISSEEAKHTAESIFAKGENELKSVQEQMQAFINSKVHGLDVAARSDLEDLAKRYHDLEKQFQALDIRLSSLEQKNAANAKAEDAKAEDSKD